MVHMPSQLWRDFGNTLRLSVTTVDKTQVERVAHFFTSNIEIKMISASRSKEYEHEKRMQGGDWPLCSMLPFSTRTCTYECRLVPDIIIKSSKHLYGRISRCS